MKRKKLVVPPVARRAAAAVGGLLCAMADAHHPTTGGVERFTPPADAESAGHEAAALTVAPVVTSRV